MLFGYVCATIICLSIAADHKNPSTAADHENPNNYLIATKSLNSLDILGEENDLFMGMELEIVYQTAERRDSAIMSFVNLQPNGYFSKWALQDEWSILNCIEYTSYPITYETMLDEIPKITAFINMTRGKVTDYTGMHLHVSRKSIEKYKPDPHMTTYDYHKYLWWKVNNQKYREKWIKLAGRVTGYAEFDNMRKSQYDDHVRYSYNEDYYPVCSLYRPDRMMALNLSPKKTIEFRMFKSSTNSNIIKQYVNGVYDVITNNSDYSVFLADANSAQ